MSFGDFLRTYWANHFPRPGHGAPVAGAPPLPPIIPRPPDMNRDMDMNRDIAGPVVEPLGEPPPPHVAEDAPFGGPADEGAGGQPLAREAEGERGDSQEAKDSVGGGEGDWYLDSDSDDGKFLPRDSLGRLDTPALARGGVEEGDGEEEGGGVRVRRRRRHLYYMTRMRMRMTCLVRGTEHIPPCSTTSPHTPYHDVTCIVPIWTGDNFGAVDDNFFEEGFDMAEGEEEGLLGVGMEGGQPMGGNRGGQGFRGDARGGVGGGRGRRVRGRRAVEVEVHINIAELLDLRGPMFTACRYACWVLIFNLCCMIVGIVAPATIGSFVLYICQPLLRVVEQGLTTLAGHPSMPPLIPLLVQRLITPTDPNTILRLDELLKCAVGFFFVGLLIVVANLCRYVLLKWSEFAAYASTEQALMLSLTVVGALGEVLKIGVMLGFRIICLPCVIGALVMLFCNNLFQAPLLEAAAWAGNNIIGAVAVLWGAGIAYMLFTTISILQLREILHPDLLARNIRPQESQSDLLSSLLMDPTLTQIKRLLASFGVYLCLSLVFIYLPIQLVVYLSSASGVLPLRMYFCYFAVEAQVPFEVGFLHTIYLMMLERYKDLVGYALHYGLLWLTKALGVQRFLMPFSMKVIKVSVGGGVYAYWQPTLVSHHLTLH